MGALFTWSKREVFAMLRTVAAAAGVDADRCSACVAAEGASVAVAIENGTAAEVAEFSRVAWLAFPLWLRVNVVALDRVGWKTPA